MSQPILQLSSDADFEAGGLVDRTIDDIRALIREKRLKPGESLPSETALSAHLGVSRPVTREAMRALSALGILKVGNGRKARVAAPDSTALSMILDHDVYSGQISIQQILDVRRTLELRTVGLAALRRTDAQARELLNLIEAMFGALNDPAALMPLDIRFHEVIAEASGNALYATIITSFRIITLQTWNIGWRSRATEENRRENIRCHERIAAAIMTQDPARAEAAMTEHFDSAVNVLLKAGIT